MSNAFAAADDAKSWELVRIDESLPRIPSDYGAGTEPRFRGTRAQLDPGRRPIARIALSATFLPYPRARVAPTQRLLLRPLSELPDKLLQVAGGNLGDGKKIESPLRPTLRAEAVLAGAARNRGRPGFGPDEKIDRVKSPAENQCGRVSTVDELQSAARQRKAYIRQISDGRRKIELPGKPRLNGVPVGRDHVHQMVCLQGTHMFGKRVFQD